MEKDKKFDGKTPEEVKEMKEKQLKAFKMGNLIEMVILPRQVKIFCPTEIDCGALISDQGTWVHDFVSCKTWIRFCFYRPISFRGYSYTFGDNKD